MLAVAAVAPIALHGDGCFRDGDGVAGRAKSQNVGGARIGVGLAVGHSHAAADRDVPALDLTFVVEDRDIAEVVGVDVDVVRRRNRDHRLEFARQISLAVNRLHDLVVTTDDLLAIEPDLAIGRRAWGQVVGNRAGEVEGRGVGLRLMRIGIAHHVAVDVAAGGS